MRIVTCFLTLAVFLLGGRLVTASETQAAWPRITLAEAKQVQLAGPLAETFERGVARLAGEPYTLDWLLADVSFKVGRIFTNYSGDVSGRFLELAVLSSPPGRLAEPQPISWARLRRQITDDVRRIKNLLSQHQKEGLPAADLQVIKRGKALEYFSRHYGKVYVEQGRDFTIREALAGINFLLDDDTSTAGGPEVPPLERGAIHAPVLSPLL
jgi:hypothetical protein